MANLAKQYKAKLRDNEADTYEQYLAKSGVDSRGIYLDSIAADMSGREIAKAKSRGLNEGLSSMGLSNSGYAEYLKEAQEKEYGAAYERAEGKLAKGEYKNQSGYEKYLSDYEKLQEKIATSVIEDFASSGSFDIEEAYKRAVFAGANEIYAMEIAGKAKEAAINKAMEKARSFAKMNSLSATKAKKYALSLGLPEFYANKIYREMDGYNESMKEYFTDMTSEEYYNYITSQK